MSTPKVIVVTGSRSFEGTDQVPFDKSIRDAAYNLFCEELWEASKDALTLFLIAGEARGPDTWAAEFVARRCQIRAVTESGPRWLMEQYRCDGFAHQIPTGNRWRWSPGPARPLDRNTKLIDVAASMVNRNTVSVLAILDSRSRTGGTMDTVRKAKAAGLTCKVVSA